MAWVALNLPSHNCCRRHAFFSAILVALILLGALPSSNALAQQVYQKHDNFSETTYFFTKRRNADLEGGSFFSGRYVAFDVNFFPGTAAPISIGVHTRTGGWIFIRDGQSLDLKIDGIDLVHLEGTGSLQSREVVDADLVTEDASYILSRDQLSKIANAKTADFRLYGDRQIITGSVSKDFLADARGLNNSMDVLGTQSGSAATLGEAMESHSDHLSLGVHYLPLNKAAIAAIHFPYDHGLMVGAVDEGSTAAKAGLQKADVILSIDGRPAAGLNDLPTALGKLSPGGQMKFRIWRNGDETDIIATF